MAPRTNKKPNRFLQFLDSCWDVVKSVVEFIFRWW